MKKRLIVLLIGMFIIISCDDSGDKNENDATADSDVTEDVGDEVTDDEVNDSDEEECTDEPCADFFEPVSENYIKFEIEGVINSGVGDFIFAQDNSKVFLNGDEFVQGGEYSDLRIFTYPVLDTPYDGADYILINSFEEFNEDGKFLIRNRVLVGLPVEEMLNAKENGLNLLTDSELYFTSFTNIQKRNRKDGLAVYKECLIAVHDPAVEESRFFVTYEDDALFAADEEIKLWGNIGISDDKDVLAAQQFRPNFEEHDGTYCRCQIGTDVPCSEWEENKDEEFDFACELPEGYLDPVGDSYATFKYEGVLNEDGSGIGDFMVQIDGTDYLVNDNAYSNRHTLDGVEFVYVYSIGSYEETSENTASLKAYEARINLDELKDMKSKDEQKKNTIATDTIKTYMIDATTITQGDDYYMKGCYIAVVDIEDPDSSIFVCNKDNVDFAEGETYKIAGNIKLTIDKEKILEHMGLDDVCDCHKNGELIDCDEFDAIGE